MKQQNRFTEEELLAIFNASSSPIFVCVGEDMVVQFANEATLKAWGKGPSVIGKPFTEALPELISQPYPQLLREVHRTGIPYATESDPAELVVDGRLQTFYFKFTYKALRDQTGMIWGVLCTATDVTELVQAKKQVEESQKYLRNMIMQAPAAICIVKAKNWEVEIANDKMLELLGATKNIITKPIFEALPGVAGQGFEQLMEQVISTGERVTAKEQPLEIERNGKKEKIYINLVYEPLREKDGSIQAIMALAIDVTEQVLLQQRKDAFIGIASHELKTPITTLKASVQLMNRLIKNERDRKLQQLLTQSASSVNKLAYLVEDLLNVSKLNEGYLNLNKEVFTLSKVVDDCCHHIRLSGTHTLNLKGDLALRVFADAHRIEQVMVNLVNNAVKYAPNSKKIDIGIERNSHFVKVSVKDTGPGIPNETIPYLFNRYYRIENPGTQISGLGLGLYISKEIVSQHGGKIGVESQIGQGSTFWFTLPLID